MGLSKKHASIAVPALLAEAMLLFAAYEAIVLMQGLPSLGLDRPSNYDAAVFSLVVAWVPLLALTTWCLLTVRASFWLLPIFAGAWWTWIYSRQVPIAFGVFDDFADYPELLKAALLTPGFRHFWLFPLAATVIVPALALRSRGLYCSRKHRAA